MCLCPILCDRVYSAKFHKKSIRNFLNTSENYETEEKGPDQSDHGDQVAAGTTEPSDSDLNHLEISRSETKQDSDEATLGPVITLTNPSPHRISPTFPLITFLNVCVCVLVVLVGTGLASMVCIFTLSYARFRSHAGPIG